MCWRWVCEKNPTCRAADDRIKVCTGMLIFLNGACCAALYVDDLKTEYHRFREMWKCHHIKIPISIGKYTTPAIGVFICNDNSHRLCANGVDMVIKSL